MNSNLYNGFYYLMCVCVDDYEIHEQPANKVVEIGFGFRDSVIINGVTLKLFWQVLLTLLLV